MSGNTVYATWPQAQTLLVNHFQHSTVEFMWDGSSTVANSMVSLCFVMNCLVMHFDCEKLQPRYKNNTTVLNIKKCFNWEIFHTYILQMNTWVLGLQKFSPTELLLVYNYAKGRNDGVHLLQTPLMYHENRFQIPSVILLEIENKNMSQNGLTSSLVLGIFTTSLLIFVNPSENIVGAGCFSCNNGIEYHWVDSKLKTSYVVSVKTLSTDELASFMHLNRVMENMQMNLFLTSSTTPLQTSVWSWSYCTQNRATQSVDDSCKVLQVFFEFSNCSNLPDCVLLYKNLFGFDKVEHREFHTTWKMLAHGQEEQSFYLQFFFPKENFFEVNFTAFLYPFELRIWLCIIWTTTVIYIWLTRLQSELGWTIFLRQCTILLEQPQSQLHIKKLSVKMVFYLWIFTSIFLRQFYTSSLHSFMTAKIEPDNYPKNMEQLLNRSDFGLIAPPKFRYNFKWRFDAWATMKGLQLPKPIETFYLKTLFKSVCATYDIYYMHTLKKLAEGKSDYVEKLVNFPNETGVEVVRRYKLVEQIVSFSKFAAVRETYGGKLIDKETFFFGRRSIVQRVPLQRHFHREVWMWSFWRASFAALPFIRFMGPFVHSGIYKMVLTRAENNRTFELLKGMNRYRELDISNGNLYGRIFMASSGQMGRDEPVATALKAFTGTFVVGAFIIGVAFVSLMIELMGRNT